MKAIVSIQNPFTKRMALYGTTWRHILDARSVAELRELASQYASGGCYRLEIYPGDNIYGNPCQIIESPGV